MGIQRINPLDLAPAIVPSPACGGGLGWGNCAGASNRHRLRRGDFPHPSLPRKRGGGTTCPSERIVAVVRPRVLRTRNVIDPLPLLRRATRGGVLARRRGAYPAPTRSGGLERSR